MAQSPLGEQFHNEVSLLKLRLARLSDNTESALGSALEQGVINEQQAELIRQSLKTDELLETGQITPESVSYEQINQIRSCAALLVAV